MSAPITPTADDRRRAAAALEAWRQVGFGEARILNMLGAIIGLLAAGTPDHDLLLRRMVAIWEAYRTHLEDQDAARSGAASPAGAGGGSQPAPAPDSPVLTPAGDPDAAVRGAASTVGAEIRGSAPATQPDGDMPRCGPVPPKLYIHAMTPSRLRFLGEVRRRQVYAEAGQAWHVGGHKRTNRVVEALASGWVREGALRSPGSRWYVITATGLDEIETAAAEAGAEKYADHGQAAADAEYRRVLDLAGGPLSDAERQMLATHRAEQDGDAR